MISGQSDDLGVHDADGFDKRIGMPILSVSV